MHCVSTYLVACTDVLDEHGNKVFGDVLHQRGTLVVSRPRSSSPLSPFNYVLVTDEGETHIRTHTWGPHGDLDLEAR